LKLSPFKKTLIGANLVPSDQIKSFIETFIENGEIQGPLADSWKSRMKEKEDVEELVRKASNNDAEAALVLAQAYYKGKKGLAQNEFKAHYWYEQAAFGGSVIGIAETGIRHALWKRPSEFVNAVALVAMAAEGGSDKACIYLGKWYAQGQIGLLKDKLQAARLLRKALSGRCVYQHARQESIDSAHKLLEVLGASK
jgi:TPR repeat protein